MATKTQKLAAKKATKPATRKTAAKSTTKTATKRTTKAKATPKAKAEPTPAPENTNKARAREMFEAGQTRREISEALGIAYATVYAHTADMKDAAGASVGRARVFVEVDGQRMSRADAMRQDYTDGMSIGDIGRKYDVIYQVAYQSVKGLIERDED